MAVAPDSIAVELGRTAPLSGSPEHAQWELWISDAQMLISARLGDLAELDQAKLDYVVRQAVAAHVRKPDDATQVSTSVDDASVSKTYRSSRGRVTILDEWWDLLAPAKSSGAFSFSPYSETSQHLPWCNLMFSREATCSCGVDLAGYPIYELP